MDSFLDFNNAESILAKLAEQLAEEKIPVQHVTDSVGKVLGTKSAVKFITHLKPGAEKHTSWNKVNDALTKQGVKTHHIAKIASHVKPAQFKEEAELEEASDTVVRDASGKVKSWKHEGDWKKATGDKPAKGTTGKHTAMSAARHLARTAMRNVLNKEHVELQEAADQHKVIVTVSDPHHTMVSQRKEKIMKRVIVSAKDKDEAHTKAAAFYKKKGYKVHDTEYHSAQPKSTLKTEEAAALDELNKSTIASYAKKSASELPKHQMNATYKATGPIAAAHAGKHPKTGESPIEWDNRKVKNRGAGIARAVDKLAKEEVELDEAKTPAQKMDFQRMMAGAMSRDEYNKKHGLGKYAAKSGKSRLDPTGVYHNLIKGVKEDTQIDELSNATLQSYKDKAMKSADDLAAKGQHTKANDRYMKHMQASGKQIDRTMKNIHKLVNKEEVQIEEAVDKKQQLRDALNRHTEKAIAANRRGDDEAVKVHQGHMNKIKDKMAKLARNEEVELGEEVAIIKEQVQS